MKGIFETESGKERYLEVREWSIGDAVVHREGVRLHLEAVGTVIRIVEGDGVRASLEDVDSFRADAGHFSIVEDEELERGERTVTV